MQGVVGGLTHALPVGMRQIESSETMATLGQWLDSAQSLPNEVALSLATEVVETVATAHQRQLTFGRLTSMDFAILSDGGLAITAQPVAGAAAADDTLEVGSILYHLLTGHRPTEGAQQQLANVEPDLSAIVMQMLHGEPEQRPHSLRIVENVLAEACERLKVEPSRTTILQWARSRTEGGPTRGGSLANRLEGQRLPLRVALSLATELVETVANVHQRKQAFGQLTAADCVLTGEGGLHIDAPQVPGAEVSTNVFEVGAVLFQMFTGLSPSDDALAKMHDLDARLSAVIAQMLHSESAQRPHSLRIVEGVLSEVCEAVGGDISRAGVVAWAHQANPTNSLASWLERDERLPLEIALSVATEVLDAVAGVHQKKLAFGRLAAKDLVVSPEGSIVITAQAIPGVDAADDTFAVGAILFQVFTGLTLMQACEKLEVSNLAAPDACMVNPAIDEALSAMLSQMLSGEPQLRPHSLRVVEGVLAEVCESMEVETSRDMVLRWVGEKTRSAN